MNPIEVASLVRSGVIQVMLEINRQKVGNGSGFLVQGGFITNSHVIRRETFDAIVLRFVTKEKDNIDQEVRVLPDTIFHSVAAESVEGDKDFVYVKFSVPEFQGRYNFEFSDSAQLSVGEQVMFLGYPFGMDQLTSHIGYVSSKFERKSIEIIQIDGSVNGGNSGGPLIDLKNGKVAGIVTRSVTGIIEQQAKELLNALSHNQKALKGATGIMSLGPIDPVEALRVSQAAMERIARDLYRSANVGIGYAYSSKYVREAVLA